MLTDGTTQYGKIATCHNNCKGVDPSAIIGAGVAAVVATGVAAQAVLPVMSRDYQLSTSVTMSLRPPGEGQARTCSGPGPRFLGQISSYQPTAIIIISVVVRHSLGVHPTLEITIMSWQGWVSCSQYLLSTYVYRSVSHNCW